MLDYYPKVRQPLFLFQSHIDFQQTNIAQEVIGPGTGGFTEAYKNRMVLPTTQSDKWLDIVIAHELTHAIQFDLLYGEGQRSFQVFKNYVIPLWVMEGMAEYCAKNWDSYADMVLRDAVLNERVPDLDQMDGFSHLDEVYVAYKAGQSAMQYPLRHLRAGERQPPAAQIQSPDLHGPDPQRADGEERGGLQPRVERPACGRSTGCRPRARRRPVDYGQALTWEDSENLDHEQWPGLVPGRQAHRLSPAPSPRGKRSG